MSKKTKHNVIISEKIEYIITHKEKKDFTSVTKVKYPDNEEWSSHIRGKTALTVKDTGNGIILKWRESPTNEDGDIEYCYERELMIALLFRDCISKFAEDITIQNA